MWLYVIYDSCNNLCNDPRMRVIIQVIRRMGQGCGKVRQHLPTQDVKVNVPRLNRSKHLHLAHFKGLMSRGSAFRIMACVQGTDLACLRMLELSPLFNAPVRTEASRSSNGKDKGQFGVEISMEIRRSHQPLVISVSGLNLDYRLVGVGSTL